ncbi:MAG: IPT/TIG domain-containing protein [Williamsia sp.]|nr:IPT/TIG domain-containing protein [Williamsia sp.]
MLQRIANRLLLFFCFVSLAGLFVACEKDKDLKSDKVQLLSFGPTGAKPGDTLRFVGTNLNQVTSIQFSGTNATVAQNAFKQQSPELILVVVPQAAEKGYVTLKTSQGDILSKTQFNLNVKTAASITGMTKQARPGENITINGNYLNWIKRITFGTGKVVTTFASQSLTQLVVRVPDDAQTAPLLVFISGTDSAEVQTADTLKVTLPVISALSPNPVKHQSNLTVTGTDLDLTRQVLFEGVSTPVTSFVSQSATQLVVKVPASAQKGKLNLVAASGVKTSSAADLDVLLPTISLIAPNPIDTGANLALTGTNLDLVSSISFVGVTNAVTGFVSQTPTQLVVKVPAGTLKGKLTLNVVNSTLTVTTAADLQINGGLPPLPDFTFPIYTDALQNTFQDWSYTDTHDFNSTANVRQGSKSIKAVYNAGNGYQGLTFHAGTAASTAGYTRLEFSVFGETGTAGKKINVIVNGNYGSPYQVTIVGGEWTTYSVTMANIGNPATLGEIVLQSAGWGGTVHVDHVGLR